MSDLGLPVAAGVFSFASTAAVAAQVPPTTDPLQLLIHYGPTVIGPALIVLATKIAPRLLAGWRARKEYLAGAKERRAKLLRCDADKANDVEAARLEDEAEALRADAAQLDAISGETRLSRAAKDEAAAQMRKHGVDE